MASSLYASSPIISYTILLVLSLFTTSSSADLFGIVCSGTLKPPTCFKVINSIPGAAQAKDLKSLAQITIAYAISNGANTQNYIKSLASSATNPRLKEDYISCSENYDDAVGSLQEAQEYLKKGNFPTVAFRATAGMTAVDDCEDGFKSPPTTDPSQLPSRNEYFDTLCIIILRIANKLSGQGPP